MKRMLILAFLVLSTAAMAGDSWLGGTGPRHRPRNHRGHSYSVAEPGVLALLGTGLVSLGIYAKKKKSKKP